MNEHINEMDYVGPPAAPDLPLPEKLVRKTAKRKLITTMTLTSDTCKWPIGDPVASNFHYCGQRPLNGRPYCDTHNSMSYQSARRKSQPENAFNPDGPIS